MSWKSIAVLTVIVTALLSYGFYYTQGMSTEERAVITLCSYEQKTSCDYTAYLKPNVLYGDTIGKGETIYIKLVHHIDVTFNYTFECSENGSIATEYLIGSVLEDPSENGWSKQIDELVSVEKMETENAKSAVLTAEFSYNITEIGKLIEEIEETIGVSSSTYQIVTTITVNTTDETGVGTISRPIEQSIVLKLNYMGGYMERGGIIEIEAPEKHLPGSITENYTKKIASAVQLRIAMPVALVAWIAAGSSFTAWRYKVGKAEFEKETKNIVNKILRKHRDIIVHSTGEFGNKLEKTIIKVESIEDLINVSEQTYKPIIYKETTVGKMTRHCFYVLDNETRYEHCIEEIREQNRKKDCSNPKNKSQNTEKTATHENNMRNHLKTKARILQETITTLENQKNYLTSETEQLERLAKAKVAEPESQIFTLKNRRTHPKPSPFKQG